MTTLESNKEKVSGPETSNETDEALIYLQSEIELNQLKNDVENQKPGEFKYEGNDRSGDYKVYSYIVKKWGTPHLIRQKAIKAKLAKDTQSILITNREGKSYKEDHRFSKGKKVYVKIPETEQKDKKEDKKEDKKDNKEKVIDNTESDIKIIDGMKCKGGEYFGIDISKFNEDIDLEAFKSWNRNKWDSKKSDTRGVSFVYIRASDGASEDKKVKKHVNKIKEYNNDKTIKDNHEQIAVGFYHRMNSYTASTQADTFLTTYNKYKNTAGGNNLVPMLDLEGDRIKNSRKEDVKNKAINWLQIVEAKTGVVPGIYVTVSIYRDYILNDNRFNKYLTRIAAYPESNKITKREKGTADRINFNEGTVDVGTPSSQKIIKPTMYQSSQEGTVDGAYAIIIENKGKANQKTYNDTDMDHTKDIRKLFVDNNKTKENKQSNETDKPKNFIQRLIEKF